MIPHRSMPASFGSIGRHLAPALLIGALALPAAAALAHAHTEAIAAKAPLVTADGHDVGSAELLRHANGYSLAIVVHDLPAGQHGVHLHTVGKCEGPTFSSAGGHLNPEGHQHGMNNPAGKHLGDMPNLVINADGKGMLRIDLPGTTATLDPQIFDADATAVVVHASADDYMTDPSGNSGSRIACGVLVRK